MQLTPWHPSLLRREGESSKDCNDCPPSLFKEKETEGELYKKRKNPLYLKRVLHIRLAAR